MTATQCRLCGGTGLSELIDLGDMPIAHRLKAAADEAEETFPFAVHFCDGCGLSQIVEPIEPEVLYGGYNYCFSSWKPQPHIADEVALIRSQGPVDSAFEVGCNDGLFLQALVDAGIAEAVGLEPNPHAATRAEERGFSVHMAMLGPDAVAEVVSRHGRFDVVIARQVLEHLVDIRAFFAAVDGLLADGGRLFIDLPDFSAGLRIGDVSVLWEEHVSYFTQQVAYGMLRHFGFRPLATAHYRFSGGTVALMSERDPAGPDPTALAAAAALHGADAAAFGDKVERYRESLVRSLQAARARGERIVLYGVGCRACTVVNGLGLGGLIDFAVDDQAERQGLFMPGSGLAIRPTDSLADPPVPTLCLLAVNNENDAKVAAKLDGLLGSKVRSITLLSPADITGELGKLAAA